MNNRGFTLVELIATIALLSIISIISFVSITTVVNDSKISNCKNLKKSIENAALEYASDNRYGVISTNINAKYLIDNNYLKSKTKYKGKVMFTHPFNDGRENPLNGYIDPESVSIRIELNSDYTVNNIIVEGSFPNCENNG